MFGQPLYSLTSRSEAAVSSSPHTSTLTTCTPWLLLVVIMKSVVSSVDTIFCSPQLIGATAAGSVVLAAERVSSLGLLAPAAPMP